MKKMISLFAIAVVTQFAMACDSGDVTERTGNDGVDRKVGVPMVSEGQVRTMACCNDGCAPCGGSTPDCCGTESVHMCCGNRDEFDPNNPKPNPKPTGLAE